MAQSGNYDRTKEDSRAFRTYQDTTAGGRDEDAVNAAAALQTKTRATNPVTAISVLPASKTLDLSDGETQQITLESTTPANKNVSLIYVSSDPTKATVSASGLVTPVAVGTSTITVKCVHDENVTDTVAITVQA